MRTLEMLQYKFYNKNSILCKHILFYVEKSVFSVVMPLKNRILRVVCFLCALSIVMMHTSAPVLADTDYGKMASVYGYVLDDYLSTYGVISDEFPDGAPASDYGTTGVVYGDVVILDKDLPPYLLIYLTEAKYHCASCHIWRYNETARKAERIAILEKDYNDIVETTGEFSLGWTDEKKYVVYKEYRGEALEKAEYYTVFGEDAFQYVNNPSYVNESGIMDFNKFYFHADIDTSFYNKQLSVFYDGLKDTAAESIQLENFADKLDKEDEETLEKTVSKVIGFKSFDISYCTSIDEYNESVKSPATDDKFYLITHLYNLGDEIYYLRFSTDRSYYNYALLRKTDQLSDGYQILKVSTDCIPLSGSELEKIKDDYMKNNLLYKKSKTSVKAHKANEQKCQEPQPTKEPKIKVKKVIDRRLRLPAACIGGAIVLSLLTYLWIKIYNED